MTDVLPLAADFPTADADAWRALVEKTLKGADFDRRLVTRTADGLAVQPLYTPAEAAAAPRRAPSGEERAWDVRAATRHPDPARANAELLADLRGGASSVLLSVDPVGAAGTAIGGPSELRRALEEVLVELAPVALDAGFHGPWAADALADICRGALEARPAFHLDPLSAFAVAGASPGPVESHIVAAATTAARLAADLPGASLFLASGRPAHEAGGSEAQELGLMAAAAVAYARALVRAGLPVEQALPRIVLGLSADADHFTTLAKLRAARAIFARIAAACGAPEAVAAIEARSSRRMLSRLDPWVNLLRLTAAGFGAATGGADAILLDAFTEPLGLPTAFARRQARNTQLVLMEEAHLGRVADPAAASGYVEALTDQLARAGWAVLQDIERQGGVVRALEAGAFQAEVAAVRDRRRREIATRKAEMVGVSAFPNLDEAAVAVEAVDPAAFAIAAPDVRRPGPDSTCAPLAPVRWAEPFERLRAGAAPAAYIATLGPAAEHAARLGFSTGLLAAGGVRASVGAPDAYDGAAVAVIAGADERYAAEAAVVARALKGRGARRVLLAGRPGEREAELIAAGVDEFVFAGGDVVAALARVHDASGPAASAAV